MGEPENEKKKISFQAHSDPTWFKKFQKNSIKTQVIIRNHFDFISIRNGMGKAENKKKKFVRVRSYLTQLRKF